MTKPHRPSPTLGDPISAAQTVSTAAGPVPELTPGHQKLLDEFLATSGKQGQKEPSGPVESAKLKAKAANLGIELGPWVKGPRGGKARRCQYIVTRGPKVARLGQAYQCPNPARKGFPVCPRHGAGYPSREATGEKENPKVVNVVTGKHVTAETRRHFASRHPRFLELFLGQLDSKRLVDFSEEVAAAKAMWRWYLEHHNLEDSFVGNTVNSPALKAMKMIAFALEAGERCMSIEEKLGPITHEQAQRLFDSLGLVIRVFVPEADRDAALDLFRRAMHRELPAEIRTKLGRDNESE